jgi:predicted ATP-dependent serine protease
LLNILHGACSSGAFKRKPIGKVGHVKGLVIQMSKSFKELSKVNFPAVQWAVPGLIPEGLVILGGKPEVGKSFLLLNLGMAVALGDVALGNVKTERGRVLYMSLDDNSERRLQERGLKSWETVSTASTLTS